jgi:hypothetical protein
MSKFLTWMSVEQSAATYSSVVLVIALGNSPSDALLALASMSFSTGSTTCTREAPTEHMSCCRKASPNRTTTPWEAT